MGKISNALEKFQAEYHSAALSEPLQPQDIDALLNYNRHNGKLNIDSPSVVKDPASLTRLTAHKMIQPNGKLTKEGIRKCEEVVEDLRLAMAGHEATALECGAGPAATPQEEVDTPVSDAEALQTGDPETGHILKYNPSTGVMDENSHRVLGVKGLVQRLVAIGLIQPNGKLTPRGIKARGDLKVPKDQRTAESEPGEATAETEADSAPTPAGEEPDRAEARSQAEDPVDHYLRAALTPLPPLSEYKKTPGRDTDPQRTESSVRPIDKALVALLAPQSFEAEQFKILRTNLLYPISGPPLDPS